MFSMEREIWRPVPGYLGYEASSLGRVRSVDRLWKQLNRWGGVSVYCGKGRVLIQTKDGAYFRVSLGRMRCLHVHVAVALAFHGAAPTENHLVAHWDDNPANNTSVNLRWALPGENAEDNGRNNRSKRDLRDINVRERRLLRS